MTSQQHCAICKEGFSPNSDGLCEKFMPSYCRTGFLTNSLQIGLSDEISSIRDMLKFVPLNLGCQSCSSNAETLLKVDPQTMLCLPSYYSQWNQFPTNTYMISNCKQYSYELTSTVSSDFAAFQTTPKCAKCLPGYLETVDGRTCHATSTALAHCLLVDSSNGQCALCADHYLIVSGACQANAIEFCQIAEYSTSSSSIECIKCDEGYYYNSSDNATGCLPGKVPNCIEYDSGNKLDCKVCKEGYQSISVGGSNKQCILLTGTKCNSLVVTSTQLASNLFECSECQTGYFLSK